MSDWETERAAVLRLVDGLGRGPDPGVVDVVTAFRCAGYRTQASCWGHAHRPLARGPWIHLVPGDETFGRFRDRVDELLTVVNTRRIADDRFLVSSTVFDHETRKPAIVRVQAAKTRRTKKEMPPPLSRVELVAARRRFTALTAHLRSGLSSGVR